MQQQELTGSIERITYYDEESHFLVAALHIPAQKEAVITGVMPGVQVGETVRCKGAWSRHPKHGLQFEVEEYQLELPKNARAIEKFLASGAIKGIGKSYAAKIVERFGDQTLTIIDQEPRKLLEIDGLGLKRCETLHASWQEHKNLQEVFLFLQGYGISRPYARRILRTYGHNALQAIRKNPYQLAKDVNGIGFSHADKIAAHLGFEK
jgi:exodeoxyribonuclease V alpha subunit